MSIIGLWGEDKACKSTLALSAPRPLYDLEFDIGGFKRACRNLPHLPIKDWYDHKEIIYKAYPLPIPGATMGVDGRVTFIPSKIITGVKELFYEWLNDYFTLLKDSKVASIIIDTGTLLYNSVICDGYLQEKQEQQLPLRPDGLGRDGKPLRVSLVQMEYREPYDRMRGIVYQAKVHNKNLIITHHATDEFKPMPQKDGTVSVQNTGRRMRHGWNQLGDSVDIMAHCYIKEEVTNGVKVRIPYCKIELAEVQELVGMEFRQPTYDDIMSVVRMVRGE